MFACYPLPVCLSCVHQTSFAVPAAVFWVWFLCSILFSIIFPFLVPSLQPDVECENTPLLIPGLQSFFVSWYMRAQKAWSGGFDAGWTENCSRKHRGHIWQRRGPRPSLLQRLPTGFARPAIGLTVTQLNMSGNNPSIRLYWEMSRHTVCGNPQVCFIFWRDFWRICLGIWRNVLDAFVWYVL